MTPDEFARAACPLLHEGIELLRAHAGEGDVINRYCATVEKVRAQYRAAKEAPAPPLVGTCKHGCRTNECETSCDDKCVVQHQESAPALLLAETCCVPWQSCEKHPRSPAPAPDVYTGPVLAGMRFKCKDSVFVPDGRRGKQGEFLNAQGDGLSEPNLRGMYRPIPDPASDVAPPGFRIVGRSGPDVPMPSLGALIQRVREVDGRPADGIARPVSKLDLRGYLADGNYWSGGCYDILEPIPATAPEPSGNTGELPTAPPAGVPVCKRRFAWCGSPCDNGLCAELHDHRCSGCQFGRPLNPPPSDPVTVATGGVPVHGCKERRAMSGLTFNAFAALNRKRCEVDFHRTLDDTNDHTVETWALKLLEEAGEVAQAVLRFGGKSARKSRTTEQDIGDEISDVVSYCALLANRLGLDFEQTVIRKWNAVSERVGSVLRIEAAIQETGGVPTGFRLGAGWTRIASPSDDVCCTHPLVHGWIEPAVYDQPLGKKASCAAHAVAAGALVPVDTARPGPAHPATGTTCTRCGQVIQSVIPAFPPVETVDGWRHERCPEVPPGPVPVEAPLLSKDGDKCPFCDRRAPHRHDFVDQASPPATPASEPGARTLSDEELAQRVAFARAAMAQRWGHGEGTCEAIATLANRLDAARAEVEQLRGRADDRVRSMREAAAKETERLYGVDNVAAKRIRSLPLDTGTATDTSGEAALPFVPWSKEAEMKESWSAPQADAPGEVGK